MKDELGWEIMIEFAALRSKIFSHWKDDNDKDKKQKTQKKVWQKKLKLEDYEHFLEANQLENKIKQLEKINLTWIVFEKIMKNS